MSGVSTSTTSGFQIKAQRGGGEIFCIYNTEYYTEYSTYIYAMLGNISSQFGNYFADAIILVVGMEEWHVVSLCGLV